MTGVSYDAGMLIALERGERRAAAIHEQNLQRRIAPRVTAGVLAQVWRGGPQASLSRALVGCIIEPLDEREARLAGVACAKAATSDVVDASVVRCALRYGDTVMTSDVADLTHIARALGRELRVEYI